MSRGISQQQQAILDALEKAKEAQSVGDLVLRLHGMDPTRSQEVSLRRALHSLMDRGLVVLAMAVMDLGGDGEVRKYTPSGWVSVSAVAMHNRGTVLTADLPDRKKWFEGFRVVRLLEPPFPGEEGRVSAWGRFGKATRSRLRVEIVNGDDMPHRIVITALSTWHRLRLVRIIFRPCRA